MPKFAHVKKASALLFAVYLLYCNSGFALDRKDTAQVNQLLRKGQEVHYSNPDSAIFYYRQIYDEIKLDTAEISPSLSEIDKDYLQTIIKALNYTGNIYYYNDEYQRSESYYRHSMELAKAAGLDDYYGRALFDIGYIRYVNNEYAEALKLFEQAYQIYITTANKIGMYNVRQACGLTYRRLGDFGKADSCYQDCLDFAASLNDSLKSADTKINFGILLCEQGRMDEGIRLFEEALAYYENKGNVKATSTALLNIGVVLKMVDEYDKALDYMKRSTEMEELGQQKSQLVVRYYNLADLYLDMGNNDKAWEYCRKIQAVASEIGSRPFDTECDFLFGKYYFLVNDLSKAEEYFKSASGNASRSNDKALIANINLWHAKTLYKAGKFSETISLAGNAYTIANDLKLLLIQKKSSGLLSDAYEKMGDNNAALRWSRTFQLHSDSLSYFNQQRDIHRIEAAYNYDKKEKENEILREKASIQEQKLRIRNIVSLALIGGFILSFVIIFLLIRRNRDARLLFDQQQMLNLQHLQEVEGELDGQKRELASKLMFLNQKNELINRLIKRLQEIQQSPDNSNDELVSIVNELRVDAPQSNWKEFETQFIQVHPGFYQRLYEKHPELSSYEQRICAFLRMNLNTKEIASITGRSAKSIEVARSRIRHKLNLKRDDNLNSFLAAI